MPDEVSVGAVIFHQSEDKRKYLLLHHGSMSKHWDVPKGNVKGNEQPVETARREIKEETGISALTFIEGFSAKINYYYKKEDRTVQKQVEYLLALAQRDRVRLSDEHIGYVWLPFKAAMEKLTFDNSKDVLEKAEAFLNAQ